MTDRRTFLRTIAAFPFIAGSAGAALATLLQTVPQIHASMWIYLWDIVDEGYEPVFRRLKECGLTGISLATAYHAGKFLAPHNPKHKVVFLEDGTVYFRPRPELYGTIKPIVNSLVKKGEDLRKVLDRAGRAGLETRSWVVCCHNTPLGRAFPAVTARTAFGDPLFHSLCPSHADVRAYLGALVKDVAAQGVSAIELEALQFQGYQHGEHHEREGIVLGTVPRFLLGLCFCDACFLRAKQTGLDLKPIRDFVRKTLDDVFANPDAAIDRYPTIESLPSALFVPLLEWRINVIASLVLEVSEAAGHVPVRPMVALDPRARSIVGVDAERVAAITGGILTPGYVRDGEALRKPLTQLQALIPGQEITVGFQVGMPESGGKTEFLDRLATARQMGITRFNFYNYGFIPLKNLEWIRDGLAHP